MREAHSEGKPNGGIHSSHSAAALLDRDPQIEARALGTASFAPLEIPDAGERRWPLSPVAWFQPEFKTRLPESSGLAIERQQRVPFPSLASLAIAPADQSHTAQKGGEPLLPGLKLRLPPSGLTPSGWEPRAVLAIDAKRGDP